MNQKITFGAFIMLNLLTATVCVKAQTTKNTPIKQTSVEQVLKTLDENDIVYDTTTVEEKPTYPGGISALYSYIGNNIKYPAMAREEGFDGTVEVEFIIDRDGTITNMVAKTGVKGGCTEEALRAIKSMPKWIPGKQKGKPVKVRYTLPIKFVLAGDNNISTKVEASFTGGEDALSKYLANNMKYPKDARKKKIKGTVIVNFIVTKDGKIKEALVTKRLNKDCDSEALRLVKSMPNWTPATINKTPINTRVSLPIIFKLQ